MDWVAECEELDPEFRELNNSTELKRFDVMEELAAFRSTTLEELWAARHHEIRLKRIFKRTNHYNNFLESILEEEEVLEDKVEQEIESNSIDKILLSNPFVDSPFISKTKKMVKFPTVMFTVEVSRVVYSSVDKTESCLVGAPRGIYGLGPLIFALEFSKVLNLGLAALGTKTASSLKLKNIGGTPVALPPDTPIPEKASNPIKKVKKFFRRIGKSLGKIFLCGVKEE